MAGIFLINPLLSEELELNLVELAVFVSEANNKNILVDESLRGENIVFIVNDKQDFFLEAFEKALNLKGLELIKNEKFYFVKKPDDFLEIEKYRTIKLNFVKFEDIENIDNHKIIDIKEGKNKTSIRLIPINQDIEKILKEQQPKTKNGYIFFDYEMKNRLAPKGNPIGKRMEKECQTP